MLYSIYQITNLVNGKSYIGFTANKFPHNRWKQHCRLSKHPTHKDYSLIHKAIRKYGSNNFHFSIICQSNNKQDALEAEKIIILQNDAITKGYNLSVGGTAPMLARNHSTTTKAKMSSKKLGSKNHFYGKTHSDETKQRISSANKGKRCGENSPNISYRKDYRITFQDGSFTIVNGIRKFCRDNGYRYRSVLAVQNNERSYHKNIIKVEKLT